MSSETKSSENIVVTEVKKDLPKKKGPGALNLAGIALLAKHARKVKEHAAEMKK